VTVARGGVLDAAALDAVVRTSSAAGRAADLDARAPSIPQRMGLDAAGSAVDPGDLGCVEIVAPGL
jgi:hypothetical protein